MSNKLLNAVYALDLICTYERHVLARIADRINDQNGVCWPSVSTIAREVCCSIRKVQGVLRVLEERNLVSIDRNAGPKGCNMYRLTLNPAADAPPHLVHPSAAVTEPPHETTLPPAPGAHEPKKKPKKTSARAECKSASVPDTNLTIQAIKEGKQWLIKSVSAYQARIWISEGKISEQEAQNVGLL